MIISQSDLFFPEQSIQLCNHHLSAEHDNVIVRGGFRHTTQGIIMLRCCLCLCELYMNSEGVCEDLLLINSSRWCQIIATCQHVLLVHSSSCLHCTFSHMKPTGSLFYLSKTFGEASFVQMAFYGSYYNPMFHLHQPVNHHSPQWCFFNAAWLCLMADNRPSACLTR